MGSQSKQLAIREFDTPMQAPPLPPPGTPAPKTSRGLSRMSDIHNNPFDHYGAVIETGTARYNTLVCQEHLDAVFYRTDPLLYHKFENMVIFRPGNLYSLWSPGNQDYQKNIHF